MLSCSGKDLQDNADMVATRITMALSAAIKSYIDRDKDEMKFEKSGMDVTVTVRPKAEAQAQGELRDLHIEDEVCDMLPSSSDKDSARPAANTAAERDDALDYRSCLVCKCYEPFQFVSVESCW